MNNTHSSCVCVFQEALRCLRSAKPNRFRNVALFSFPLTPFFIIILTWSVPLFCRNGAVTTHCPSQTTDGKFAVLKTNKQTNKNYGGRRSGKQKKWEPVSRCFFDQSEKTIFSRARGTAVSISTIRFPVGSIALYSSRCITLNSTSFC